MPVATPQALTACTEFRFSGTDELQIACARWDSRGDVRGVVQIAHGISDATPD